MTVDRLTPRELKAIERDMRDFDNRRIPKPHDYEYTASSWVRTAARLLTHARALQTDLDAVTAERDEARHLAQTNIDNDSAVWTTAQRDIGMLRERCEQLQTDLDAALSDAEGWKLSATVREHVMEKFAAEVAALRERVAALEGRGDEAIAWEYTCDGSYMINHWQKCGWQMFAVDAVDDDWVIMRRPRQQQEANHED